jgi:hypothetical protein
MLVVISTCPAIWCPRVNADLGTRWGVFPDSSDTRRRIVGGGASGNGAPDDVNGNDAPGDVLASRPSCSWSGGDDGGAMGRTRRGLHPRGCPGVPSAPRLLASCRPRGWRARHFRLRSAASVATSGFDMLGEEVWKKLHQRARRWRRHWPRRDMQMKDRRQTATS